MSNSGQFRPGPDPRRNTSSNPGRAPSSASLASTTRAVLGRDLRSRLQQLTILADAGDPRAVVACATLLAAAMGQSRG